MRSRLTSLLLVAPLLATGLALLDAAPAAAEDTGVCTLLTRSEAGKLLGAKVVKTQTKTSAADGAQRCTYKTNKAQKAFNDEFKGRDLKMQLAVTAQPLTDEVRAQLQRILTDEGERLEGLGDEAYATKFDEVIALSGNAVVAAKLQNFKTSSTKFRTVSEGAVRTALPRLDQLTLAPPNS